MAERMVRRRSAAEWQRLIAQLPEDQDSQAEFCRRRGIHRPTLQWWRSRLRRRGAAPPAKVASTSPPPGSRFTELQVVQATTASSKVAGFELRWPDGLLLAIPASFAEESLRRLLRVLEESGC
jgi:transposase-like protein